MVIEKKGCRENNKSGMLDMTVCDAVCHRSDRTLYLWWNDRDIDRGV